MWNTTVEGSTMTDKIDKITSAQAPIGIHLYYTSFLPFESTTKLPDSRVDEFSWSDSLTSHR